jgi:hypothetical protein
MAAPAEPNDLLLALATALGETETGTIEDLGRVLDVLGPERMGVFVEAAQALHAAGGMVKTSTLFNNRQARMDKLEKHLRTVGGIFFFLVSQHPKGCKVVLPHRLVNWPMSRVNQQPARPAKQPHRNMQWSDREAIAATPKGEALNVKITLTGRPAQVTKAQACVAFILTQKKPPTLPKGLPTPPAEPTDYMVFVSEKQWRKVEQAMEDPTDQLFIEGWCAIDVEGERIAVFATNTTTRNLKKKSQPPSVEPDGSGA